MGIFQELTSPQALFHMYVGITIFVYLVALIVSLIINKPYGMAKFMVDVIIFLLLAATWPLSIPLVILTMAQKNQQ